MDKNSKKQTWMRLLAVTLACLIPFGCEADPITNIHSGSTQTGKERKMTMPIDVPAPIWGAQLPSTPELSGQIDELSFNVVPGTNNLGPTVVLTGRYLVHSPILDYYGGQLPAPIHVVAIEESTGTVYCHPLVQAKSPPVRVMVPEGVEPPPSNRSQGASFNIDLPVHLRLPATASKYHVFLWLDHILSPVVVVEVPENPKRTQLLQSMGKPSSLVDFNTAASFQSPGAETITLGVSDSSNPSLVEGTLSLDDSRDREKTNFLSLLALNHRDRSIGWTSVDLNSLSEVAQNIRFQFDTSQLVGKPQGDQKVFVVAYMALHDPVMLVLKPQTTLD